MDSNDKSVLLQRRARERLRNLLVKNELQEKLFAEVVEQLTAKGLIPKKGKDSRFNDNSSADHHQKQGTGRRRLWKQWLFWR